MSSNTKLDDPAGLFVGATVELLRPVIGTPEEGEVAADLVDKLVAGWGYSPAMAGLFVTKVISMVRDGEAD